MNKILTIIKNDFKVVFTDKMFLFWTVILPVIFIAIFGRLNYSGPGTLKAELHILNKDRGQWGSHLVKCIESNSMAIIETDKIPDRYNRLLTIPENFSEKFAKGTSQTISLTKATGKNMNAALQAEIRIVQSIAKILCNRILNPDAQVPDDIKSEYEELIGVDSNFLQKISARTPSGSDHAVPGVIIQFIMMSLLIYGGVFIIMDRKKGRLERILYTPVTMLELWIAKLSYRTLLGVFQAAILMVIGITIFNMNMGNILYSAINVVLFSMTIASLSILLGSLISKEELAVGISVLLSNVFAALAGCWWPIEIVSGFMRKIAMVLPSYWAMDAFHKIIFFGTDFSELSVNFLVLTGYTVVFAFLSIKFFKARS